MKLPTSACPHFNWACKNTGKAMTNQMSLDPNNRNLAIASKLIERLLENKSLNLGLFLPLPISFFKKITLSKKTANKPHIKHNRADLKPTVPSKIDPIKKPAPLSAFFEPVNRATHL